MYGKGISVAFVLMKAFQFDGDNSNQTKPTDADIQHILARETKMSAHINKAVCFRNRLKEDLFITLLNLFNYGRC